MPDQPSDMAEAGLNELEAQGGQEADTPAPAPKGRLTFGLTLLMAVATGVIVANLNYIQPLMGDIARGFGVEESRIGYAVMLSQAGLAAGTLMILPLGDITDRRRLILMSCLGAVVSLVVMATAPNVWVFLAANLSLGITSIATHLQVSYAAHLADPARRARAVGAVMSGLLLGILGARVLSGYAGAVVSWRVVLWGAAAGTLFLAALLRAWLPRDDANFSMRYGALLSSIPRLFFQQPVLRDACIYGGLTFAAFNAFWSTLTFHLEGPPFGMGTQAIGLFSLVAMGGALAANGTGYLIARVHPLQIIMGSLVIMLVSFGLYYAGGATLIGMIVGVVLMDLGIQAAHISNQALIHALMPEARNRIHCAYMVCYFVGGSVGSGVGTWSYAHMGWTGLCLTGGFFSLAALIYWMIRHNRSRKERVSTSRRAMA